MAKIAECTKERLSPYLRQVRRVVDRLVEVGVRAILNFTNATLDVSAAGKGGDVNMAIERESLTYAIGQQA